MTSPLVSVVAGWYNRMDGTRESVESILGQTFADFEFIIFDDASTDGTRELLESFDDPRIRLIKHERNIGLTRGLINAVGLARGKYIARQDAGDISHPTRLEKQVAHMESHPACVAVGCVVRNLRQSTGKVTTWCGRPDRIMGRGNAYTHGEVMFRREEYDKCGGYRPVFYYAQDRDLWLRLSEMGELQHVNEVLYERRIFAEGIGGNASGRHLQSIFSNLARHSARCRRANGEDPVERRHALSLLTQEADVHFTAVCDFTVRTLLTQSNSSAYRELIGVTPMSMLSTRDILLYAFFSTVGRHKAVERIFFSIFMILRFVRRRSIRFMKALGIS